MSFTEDTINALSAKLSSEHIKTRKQSGRSLSYIEGWVAIAEANRIFGFDAWTRETVYCKEVSRHEVTIGKGGQYERPGWKVGYEAKVKITVGDVVREGTGHGSASMADLFDCIESAAKEAETDAMKRAFMTFGNPFGLALYDKEQRNVERNGGYSAEADEQMAQNISNYERKFDGVPKLIPVPDIEDEAARWKKWAQDLIHAIGQCKAPEEVDQWIAKNGVPLGSLGNFSEKAYDHIQTQAEAKKEKLGADSGLDDPGRYLEAG